MRYLLILLFLMSSLSAALTEMSEVHEGDYFAVNDRVIISGVITGNATLIGDRVKVTGVVEGNLRILGSRVEVSGRVGKGTIIFADRAELSGTFGSNVRNFSDFFLLDTTGMIGGDLTAFSYRTVLDGRVGENATVYAYSIDANGQIGENLNAYVRTFTLSDDVQIGGDVQHSEGADMTLEPGAQIRGEVVVHTPFIQRLIKNFGKMRFSKLIGRLMNFFFTLGVGAIFIYLFPKQLKKIVGALAHHPIKSLLFGILLAIILPVFGALLLVTIIGVPFALALLALTVIGFFTVKVYPIMWMANKIFKSLKPYTFHTFLLGLIIYILLTAIPFYVGVSISFFAMLLGLGAFFYILERKSIR